MIVFLVRHGQSEANLHTYYTGQMDVPLTQLGREQAMSVAPILSQFPIDKVYSSDLSRAWETCELAIPGAEYEKMELLREYDVGSVVGVNISDVVRIEPDDVTLRPDYTCFGGENAKMVRKRARDFLTMLEKTDSQYVAVFSHFGFINCVLKEVLDAHFQSSCIKTGNCAVHAIEFDGERWKLLSLNYMMPIIEPQKSVECE